MRIYEINRAPINSPSFTGSPATTSLVLSTFLNEAKGADIASATTTDIGAATGNYVVVTGTTTITGLGTVQAGTRRVVKFSGALTLTHNASSLILPGGVNITTVAGDTAQFVSLGSGNWICVNYQCATITGTGSAVRATSPSLTTPTLGVASATSINFGGDALSAYNNPTTYTPTWNNGVIGNGTWTASYTRIGKLVTVLIKLQTGSTTTYGSGTWSFTLPSTASNASYIGGSAIGFNSGVAYYTGIIEGISTTAFQIASMSGASNWQSNIPASWGAAGSTYIRFFVTYFES